MPSTKNIWVDAEWSLLAEFYFDYPYPQFKSWRNNKQTSFKRLERRINSYNKLNNTGIVRTPSAIEMHLQTFVSVAGYRKPGTWKVFPIAEKTYKTWMNDKLGLKQKCITIEYHLKQAKGKKSGKKPKKIIYDEGISPSDNELTIAAEGKDLRVVYYKKERNASLKKKRVNWFKQNNRGKLQCENCNFNFKKVYNRHSKSSKGRPHGEGYIESHHREPLHKTGPVDTNWKKDLILLCSNCHRMVHRSRKKFLTIDELAKITKTKFK